MSVSTEQKQLEGYSLSQINEFLAKAYAEKTALEAQKKAKGKNWTDAEQEKLTEVVMTISDLEEAAESKKASAKSSYEVKPGTEDLVHLLIVKGRRFNSKTGKEESKPYVQLFTHSEWRVFKEHFKGLGYLILGVMHDPYNEAEPYVFKEDE